MDKDLGAEAVGNQLAAVHMDNNPAGEADVLAVAADMGLHLIT